MEKDHLQTVYVYYALSGFCYYDRFFGGSDFIFESKPMGGLAGLFSADFFVSVVGVVGGIIISCFIATLLLFLLYPKFFMKIARADIKIPKRKKDPEPEMYDTDEYQGEVPDIRPEKPETEPEYIPEPAAVQDDEPTVKEISKVEKGKRKYSVPLRLLDEPVREYRMESDDELKLKGEMLVAKLADFGVNGKIREIQPGLL